MVQILLQHSLLLWALYCFGCDLETREPTWPTVKWSQEMLEQTGVPLQRLDRFPSIHWFPCSASHRDMDRLSKKIVQWRVQPRWLTEQVNSQGKAWRRTPALIYTFDKMEKISERGSKCTWKKTGWRKLTVRRLISTNYLHWQGEELIWRPEENDNSYPFPTNTITLTIIGFDVCWLDLHILNVSVVYTPPWISPQKSNETAPPNVSAPRRP